MQPDEISLLREQDHILLLSQKHVHHPNPPPNLPYVAGQIFQKGSQQINPLESKADMDYRLNFRRLIRRHQQDVSNSFSRRLTPRTYRPTSVCASTKRSTTPTSTYFLSLFYNLKP